MIISRGEVRDGYSACYNTDSSIVGFGGGLIFNGSILSLAFTYGLKSQVYKNNNWLLRISKQRTAHCTYAGKGLKYRQNGSNIS